MTNPPPAPGAVLRPLTGSRAAARTGAVASPRPATPGPRCEPRSPGDPAGSRRPAMPSNKSVSDAPIVQFTNCRILRSHQLQR